MPLSSNRQRNMTYTIGYIQGITQKFHLAAVESQQKRTARERTGIRTTVIVGRQRKIVRKFLVMVDRRKRIRQKGSFPEHFSKRPDLVLMVFRDADIPYIVMPEVQTNGIRPSSHHHSHASVSQQCPFEEAGRRLVHHNRVTGSRLHPHTIFRLQRHPLKHAQAAPYPCNTSTHK